MTDKNSSRSGVPIRRAISRRHLLIAGGALLLSACSEGPLSSVSHSLKTAVQGPPDVELTRQKVMDLPYAQLAAKLGSGPRVLLVLGSADRNDLNWISADQGALVTRNGRVIRTAGLIQNLRNTRFLDPDPLASPFSGRVYPGHFRRLVDISPYDHYDVLIQCRWRVAGSETIRIVENEYSTQVVKEICSAPTLDWEFENTYWLDSRSGYVWQSQQHVAPKLDPVLLQMLKPPVL